MQFFCKCFAQQVHVCRGIKKQPVRMSITELEPLRVKTVLSTVGLRFHWALIRFLL